MKVDPKTGQYDLKEFQEYMHKRSYRGRLEEYLKCNTGDFSTEIPCNCGKEACIIQDKARAYYAPPRYSRPPLIGEERPPPWPSSISHVYYGSECGASYVAEVIEKKRGYVPREKRKKEDETEED